jgi:2-Cys peroxiredoxin 5
LKQGSQLPNSTLYENTPVTQVKVHDLFKGKKGILFAVPGAFTPGCSKTHLPGYIENYDLLKEKGYETVVCVTVNDPFVAGAWAVAQNAAGKVRVLADTNAEFTKAIGMDKEIGPLGGVRSKRYTLVVEDNVVKNVFEEPDGTGLSCK